MTDITQVIVRTGTTAQVKAYIGPVGEMVLDTQTLTLYVQDGVTPGGWLPFPGNALVANVANAIISNTTMTNYVIAQDAILANAIIANIVTVNSNIVTANNAVVSYVNTLNSAMTSNITAANLAIITANNYAVSANTATWNYVNALNVSMLGNVTNANVYNKNYTDSSNAVVFAQFGATNTYISNLNAAMAANVAGANFAIIANSASTNANIVTANNAVVSYVNTLNSAMIANVAGANAAIVTANNAVVSYVNTQSVNLSNAIVANSASTNANIVTANNAVVAYVNTLNSAMASNVAGANAAIVTANSAVVSYIITQDSILANTVIANTASTNANIVTANNAVVAYVNTLNGNMASNVAGANAAIITANNAVVAYVNTINGNVTANVAGANAAIIGNVAVLNANIAGANAAIVTANNAVVSYVNTLNSVMIGNVNGANAAIVTANNAVVSYIITQDSILANAIIANVAGANAAIVTANNAVVAYVNTLNSTMSNNVVGANAAITALQASVYANANVAAYLITNSGNISAGNITAFKSSFSNGIVSSGNIISTFTDGIAIDYLQGNIGNARISIGSGDVLTFYSNGVGNIQMAQLSSSGLSVVGNISPTVGFLFSTGNIAAAGGNQATATQITSDNTFVVGGTGGVVLPVPVLGREISITNNNATSIVVYPSLGSSIENAAINSGVTVPAYATLGLEAKTLTNWWAIQPVYNPGTNMSITQSANGTVTWGLSANVLLGNGSIATGNIAPGVFTDGIAVDYVNGNGRISVGSVDTLNIYSGGAGAYQMAQLSNVGLAVTGTISSAGSSVPYSLLSTGVPFVLPSSGTIGNNGALSGITPVDAIYPSAYVYLPTNAISTGSSAGWYYAAFSTNAAAIIYNNTYTAGVPNIPAIPTTFVTTGPGAFTTNLGNVAGPTISLPALNPHSYVDVSVDVTSDANVGPKFTTVNVGGVTISQLSRTTSNISQTATVTMTNRGSVSQQRVSLHGTSWTQANGGAYTNFGINTLTPVTLLVTLGLSAGFVANTTLVVENVKVVVTP